MTQIEASEFSSELEIEERVRKVELLISNLLRLGVLLSLALVVCGAVVSFVQHPEYLSDRSFFGQPSGPRSPILHSLGEVGTGLRAFQGEAIVTLGILLLIATPVIRVGVSIFAFIYQRDRLYTVITATVFCLLLLSFVLGKAE
ncbi:MAG: DUF1634 domain-containing protein [Chloroflexota bacterium]|jgi:uncharacterized membrane protein